MNRQGAKDAEFLLKFAKLFLFLAVLKTGQ